MSAISTLTRQLLALSQLAGVGPATLKKIINLPGFAQLTIDELAAQSPPISRALSVITAWEEAQDIADKQIAEANRHDARIISALDADYPQLLAATKDDPLILFVRGKLSPNPDNSVAIIGTREPTAHGQEIARRVAQFFAEEHWSVVSGLAIGCDSIAHEATLDAGGHTIAVLAHGLQMIAPSRNRKLSERILAAGGALVSEYPFGREVQRQQYVKRDRTQAGLAQGVVMIQSDVVGGSLHASRAALDYHRWLAVPYPTKMDREYKEPKIQANLMIALGAKSDQAKLLRCSESSLSSVLVLNNRNDYLLMKEGVCAIVTHASLTEFQSADLSEEEPISQAETLHSDANENSLIQSSLENNVIGPASAKDASTGVSCTQLSIKSIVQSPALDQLSKWDWGESPTQNIGVINALSARLNYLQGRLKDVQLCLENVLATGDQSQQRALCFSVDDFVGQMTHATEFLVAVHLILTEPTKYHEKVAVDTSDASDIGAEHTQDAVILINRELSNELRNLRDSSTSRLIVTSDEIIPEKRNVTHSTETNNHVATWIEELASQLENLCDGFNRLTWLVLFDRHDSLSHTGTSKNHLDSSTMLPPRY